MRQSGRLAAQQLARYRGLQSGDGPHIRSGVTQKTRSGTGGESILGRLAST